MKDDEKRHNRNAMDAVVITLHLERRLLNITEPHNTLSCVRERWNQRVENASG